MSNGPKEAKRDTHRDTEHGLRPFGRPGNEDPILAVIVLVFALLMLSFTIALRNRIVEDA